MSEANITQGQITRAASLSRLASVMARAGWEIAYVDLDLVGDAPRAEIRISRTDGRWLLARADSVGRCTIETFHRNRFLGRSANTKGRQPLCPQIEDLFMGRRAFPGARAMLRILTAYVADNAISEVALADVRAAWASLMGAPLLLEHNTAPEAA